MVPTELLNTIQGLNHADKLYIIQVLVSQLAQEEIDLIKPDQKTRRKPLDRRHGDKPIRGFSHSQIFQAIKDSNKT